MTCRLFLVSPALTTANNPLINISDPQTFQTCFLLLLPAPLRPMNPDLSTSLRKPSFVFDVPLKRKVAASAPTNLILIVLQCSTLILTSQDLVPILTLWAHNPLLNLPLHAWFSFCTSLPAFHHLPKHRYLIAKVGITRNWLPYVSKNILNNKVNIVHNCLLFCNLVTSNNGSEYVVPQLYGFYFKKSALKIQIYHKKYFTRKKVI